MEISYVSDILNCKPKIKLKHVYLIEYQRKILQISGCYDYNYDYRTDRGTVY